MIGIKINKRQYRPITVMHFPLEKHVEMNTEVAPEEVKGEIQQTPEKPLEDEKKPSRRNRKKQDEPKTTKETENTNID